MSEPPAKITKFGSFSGWVTFLLFCLKLNSKNLKFYKFHFTNVISESRNLILGLKNVNVNFKMSKWVCIFSSFRQNEEGTVEFNLLICFDVLLELLRFGCRRRLSKLERVGRRFHWLVKKWFPDVPFLRLNLELKPLLGYMFFFSINFN